MFFLLLRLLEQVFPAGLTSFMGQVSGCNQYIRTCLIKNEFTGELRAHFHSCSRHGILSAVEGRNSQSSAASAKHPFLSV